MASGEGLDLGGRVVLGADGAQQRPLRTTRRLLDGDRVGCFSPSPVAEAAIGMA
jgi:hypothetical protein